MNKATWLHFLPDDDLGLHFRASMYVTDKKNMVLLQLIDSTGRISPGFPLEKQKYFWDRNAFSNFAVERNAIHNTSVALSDRVMKRKSAL